MATTDPNVMPPPATPEQAEAVYPILKFFRYHHLPEGLQAISATIYGIAYDMAMTLPRSPELSAGLRKLLEAKDCFVRAGMS